MFCYRGVEIAHAEDPAAGAWLVGRFVLGELVVQISRSSDRIATPYLMLRAERLCADAAAAPPYRTALTVRLASVQVVDKIHLSKCISEAFSVWRQAKLNKEKPLVSGWHIYLFAYMSEHVAK